MHSRFFVQLMSRYCRIFALSIKKQKNENNNRIIELEIRD
jgi:hypothetical protein